MGQSRESLCFFYISWSRGGKQVTWIRLLCVNFVCDLHFDAGPSRVYEILGLFEHKIAESGEHQVGSNRFELIWIGQIRVRSAFFSSTQINHIN